jgi:hypothetical protein
MVFISFNLLWQWLHYAKFQICKNNNVDFFAMTLVETRNRKNIHICGVLRFISNKTIDVYIMGVRLPWGQNGAKALDFEILTKRCWRNKVLKDLRNPIYINSIYESELHWQIAPMLISCFLYIHLKLPFWNTNAMQRILVAVLHPKPTHKLVSSHLEHSRCWDKPRATMDSFDSSRPGLGGNHHLPPYNIICASSPHLHLNGTFSRDSQNGVPKLSWFRLSRFWAFITSRSDLRLGQDLKQTCSSSWKLSNNVLHLTFTLRDQVDSRLLVVGSQIASLAPGPSFNHN